MNQTERAVGVIVQPSQDDRPARGAGCSRAERVIEADAGSSERIDIGRRHHRVPVTPHSFATVVICHDHHDVWQLCS